jgi:hypothetical protein
VFFTKYYSCNGINDDDMGGTCSTHREDENACKTLVGKPAGKKLLRRAMCRCVNNIEIHLDELGWI